MLAFAQSLKAWADRENMPYQDLARRLGMSPSSLSDVFRQRNNFTGAQVLRALELMKDPRNLNDAREAISTLEAEIAMLKSSPPAVAKSPPTHAAVKPPVAPTPTKPAVVPPRQSAWEREVARANAAATANLSSKPLEEQNVLELTSALNNTKDPSEQFQVYAELKQKRRAAQLTAAQAPPIDPAALPGFQRVQSPPPPPPVKIPESKNTPFLISEVLKTMSFPDVLSALGNPENSALQRALCYSEAQSRRAITQDPV